MTRTRLTALAATAALAATGSMITAAPASAAVTCTSPVWKAQYFGNTTFAGTPKLTACDAAISENYGYGDPAGVTLPKDNFSVRWSLTRDFGSGGPFRLSAATQDGMRVYVDGVRKIDLWKNVSTTARKTVDVTVPAGKHTLRVDYVAWTGLATAGFTYTPRTEAAVDTVKPLAPTGLTAAYNRDTTKTTLRWAANKEMDLAGYRVYRRLGAAAWARVSGASLLASPSFVDATPATGQTFLYEVRAVDKAGRESAGSTDATAVTVDRTGPAAPTGLTVTGDAWWSVLAWQQVADAARYEVYAASAPTGPFELLGTTDTTSYRTYSPVNTVQYYRVRALDALGNPSAYATVTGDGVDRTPPKAPTSLDSLVRVDYTNVYWKQPDGFYEDYDNGGGYRVYRSTGKTLDPSALTRVTCVEEESDETSTGGVCHDLDMPEGTYVTYAVTAVDPAGNESALSAPLVVRTGDRVAPGPVTGVHATPRADGVLMSWSASTEDDVERYVAWTGTRQADGTVKWLSSTSCREGTSDPLAVLCGDLPDGETYVYAVVAKDRWGNALHPSDPGVTVVEATELDVRPTVTVTRDWDLGGVGHGTVIGGPDEDGPSISWRCDRTEECDTVAGYRVSRWNAATKAYEPLHADLLPTDARAYTDTTAARGTTHFYTLEAVRADGSVAGTYVWSCVFQDRV
ncbi:fibronectin type 3 domain-containing protein [Streptomyces sp. 3330]|uniref:PA14 domain-containing protein n=1 Tax=Streptomyces sp. 3330 TaxID=2817755 RepID=UPI0028564AA6|nr:PA14 domain-containing protein [Streptomyces sp. 3330]MDR6978480.1 fibronectin type 3 domain-containing protein [Streptomyces sp. 3330]